MDESPRPGVARGGSNQRGVRTSSVQGCPLALALLDEGRGAMGCKHLHTLSRASLSSQEERGPALVVPYIQIHQRLGQCLQGFTVTIVGLEGCGQPIDTTQDTVSFCSSGPWGDSNQQSPLKALQPLGFFTCTMPSPLQTTACLPHLHKTEQGQFTVCAPACGSGEDKAGKKKRLELTAKCKGLTGMVLSTSSRQLKDISKSCNGRIAGAKVLEIPRY